MPNGGTDCCGTCWFNRNNEGEEGPHHYNSTEEAYCEIRDFSIENPFHTYCVNHPYRRPDRDTIPIGPVFVDEGQGRRPWRHSPDTEQIRTHLLELLREIEEQPGPEYSASYHRDRASFFRDEVVVWQIGEFKEQRAQKDLKRILAFDPTASVGNPVYRTRETLIDAARDAIAKLKGV